MASYAFFAIRAGGWLAALVPAVIISIVSAVMMIVNGYRIVIGFRIYSDHLEIITPLGDFWLPWNEVYVYRYPAIFLGLEIVVSGMYWPYTFIATPRTINRVADLLEEHA